MNSRRGPLQSKKIDMKSTSGTFKQERKQGTALLQPWTLEVDFIPHLPIRNQYFTLSIHKEQDRYRKWGLPRANPIDRNRCIEALRVISYRFLSIESVFEGFLGVQGGLEEASN